MCILQAQFSPLSTKLMSLITTLTPQERTLELVSISHIQPIWLVEARYSLHLACRGCVCVTADFDNHDSLIPLDGVLRQQLFKVG